MSIEGPIGRFTVQTEQMRALQRELGAPTMAPRDLLAAAVAQKRKLEATAATGQDEAASSEVRRLTRELEGLRSDLRSRERMARRENELDARDEAEEAADRARIAGFMHIDPNDVI